MIATFLLEFFGAIYAIIRYKMDRVGFITVLILTCLSVFQIAEYMICEVINLPGLTWARIGYVAITLLPPLGISLMMAIANKKSLITQLILYFVAGSFIVYFLFIAHALTNQVCSGNYVIFTASEDISKIYGLYYYGLLAITVFFSFQWTHHVKSVGRQKAL
ncbi:hypothetical protein H7Y40_02295, partial [Pedobacter sp.]|nr:hypothetical protein [Candidatus Saccharibacteria bacterium]